LDWAAVTLDGQKAVLTGVAPNADAQARAREVVIKAAGAGGRIMGGIVAVEDRSSLPGAGAPYAWRAVAAGGQVELSGSVPSDAVRLALVTEARRLFEQGVSDRMQVVEAAPAGDWQRVAVTAIRQLVRLDRGSVEFNDTTVVVQGETADRARAGSIQAAVERMPEGYAGRAVITPPIVVSGVVPQREPVVKPVAPAPAPLAEATLATAECQRELDKATAGKAVRFQQASNEIEQSSQPLLQKVAGIIRLCSGVRVRIGGHTDARGRLEFNQQLSLSRASSVADYLVKAGVPGERLVAVGYGPSRPVATNDTEDGRARNRRITFEVVQQ
jgi:outer membrane protein OmpA-like peptidoglycan-associated protein